MPDFERLTRQFELDLAARPEERAFVRGLHAGLDRARWQVVLGAMVFLVAVLLAVSINAAAQTPPAPTDTDAFLKEKIDEIYREARPLSKGLYVTDSKGCLWFVVEEKGKISVVQPLQDHRPVCRAVSDAKTEGREALLQRMTFSMLSGACSVVLQKQVRTGQDGAAQGQSDYAADNKKLHQCQYVHEMADSPCVKARTCPTYEAWSARYPGFSPDLPRGVFIATLEARQHSLAAAVP